VRRDQGPFLAERTERQPMWDYLLLAEDTLSSTEYPIDDGTWSSPAAVSWCLLGAKMKPLSQMSSVSGAMGSASVITQREGGLLRHHSFPTVPLYMGTALREMDSAVALSNGRVW